MKRLPTATEWEELMYSTDGQMIHNDKQKGMKLVGRNGNSIFLPSNGCSNSLDGHIDLGTDGYYWSASLYKDDPNFAWLLHIYESGHFCIVENNTRQIRLSVRLVSDTKEEGFIDLGLTSGLLWAEENVEGYYLYNKAIELFNANVPSPVPEKIEEKLQGHNLIDAIGIIVDYFENLRCSMIATDDLLGIQERLKNYESNKHSLTNKKTITNK